jgi:hypothetical protein
LADAVCGVVFSAVTAIGAAEKDVMPIDSESIAAKILVFFIVRPP